MKFLRKKENLRRRDKIKSEDARKET